MDLIDTVSCHEEQPCELSSYGERESYGFVYLVYLPMCLFVCFCQVARRRAQSRLFILLGGGGPVGVGGSKE